MDVQEFGCPPFSAEDIKDFSALAGKLARQSDPVSGFIWQKLLPSEDNRHLRSRDSSEQNLKKAKLVLVEELNDMMEIGSACHLRRSDASKRFRCRKKRTNS